VVSITEWGRTVDELVEGRLDNVHLFASRLGECRQVSCTPQHTNSATQSGEEQ